MKNVTCAIIAGGKSSRMGTDKAFVQIGSKTMIERAVERIQSLQPAETILIANKPEAYAHLNLPTYTDLLPEKGSLGGIYTALHHAAAPYTLVVACDMPFLNTALLRHMIALINEHTQGYDVIVPRVDGYPQGMHAIYQKTCLDPIRKRLEADKLKIIGFYDEVRVRYLDEEEYRALDPDSLAFFNANTPEELEEARRRAQK